MKGKILRSLIAGVALTLGITLVNSSSASAAWKQDSNGWWNSENGSYSTYWKQIDGTWYYFGSDGYMKTGWLNDNGAWYYLQPSGSMKTGWLNDNGIWYYLQSSGAMKTGWLNDNGTWYYLQSSGAMKTGLLELNGKTYYLNESGAMVKGDITLNGVKYTFNENGEKVSSQASENDVADNSNANNTTTNNADSNNNAKNDEVESAGSSGGGGGGGASSKKDDNVKKEDDTKSDFASYSDLYGKWKIDSVVDSGLTSNIPDDYIKYAIGQSFTISKDNISNILYKISDVKTSETILTDSEFESKFGTTLSKIGIAKDKVKCITASGTYKDKNRTMYIVIDSSNNVYAIASNTVFKLKKA